MRYRLWLLPAIMLLLAPHPALARARDDAMAGVFRCAAIGDARLWLDCYYGAAQPVRAQLGLPPVPAAQARLVQSPPAGEPAGEPAGDMTARYQVMSSVLHCNNLAGDREWLDCFYGVAQPVRAELGLLPAPQARAPIENGLRVAVPGPAPIARTVDPQWSRMTSYSFNRYGTFTVTLANGQVWRQLSGDTDFAHWTKPAPAYAARITRGALGSFNLKVKGGSEVFKVEQVK